MAVSPIAPQALVQPLDIVRAGLAVLHGAGMTWRQIRAEFYPSVPPGTLCAVAHGRNPRKASIRRALGLPVDPLILASPRMCACGCGIGFVPVVHNQIFLPGHRRR